MSATVRLIACPTVLVLLLAALPAFAQAPAKTTPATPARTTPAAPARTTPATVPLPPPVAGTEAPLTKPKPTRNPAFYNAELTISSQNAAERRGATIRALGVVLVRLSGNPQAAANPVIRRASSNIDSLVLESKVRQDSETVNGVPVYKTVLSVSFDPDTVDALLAGAGLKFWSSTRPKPILWLAIDDGRGPRLVTGQQTNVVKPLATRGLERGMRFLLPAGTTTEQAAINSIWALNGPALEVLTNRYRNDMQLVGKVYRQPPGWAADWMLSQGGTELARWSFADSDPRRVIASGVDEGANAIAKRDAVTLDTGVAGPQLVDISGVDTQGDFIRLMSYLQTLPVVRKVTVIEARPGSLRLELDLGLGLRGLLPMIATGNVLLLDSESTTGGVARFSLQ